MSGEAVDLPEVPGTGNVEACQLRHVLDRVGGKWSVQVIVAAAGGPVRYTELERSIDGISRRMLTVTLRTLERDGLLVRKVYPTVPPRVEYSLTERADELHRSLLGLASWARRHGPSLHETREAYDHTVAAAVE